METETKDTSNNTRRWWILAIVGIAQLMVVLDATIVNIALPSAQHDLGFSNDSRQWVVTAYALAFGSLLLLGGRIGDMFGRKRTFIAGLLGFGAASAIGGVADSFETLIAARALQGAFGALLAPAALSILSTTFNNTPERGKAFGVYGAIAGGGGAVGLLLGGILTEYLSWRWCMLVNLGFAIPAAIGAIAILRDRRSASSARIDIPGALAATLGLFGIVYGFSSAEMNGWGDVQTVGSLAAGISFLAAFVAIELRVAQPLLPMRVLANRTRAGSFVAVLTAGAGMFGVFLFLTYYLQVTLGFSPVQTGLAFLPMMIVLVTTSVVVNTKVIGRTGPRPLVPTGMALAVAGMLYLTGISVTSTYASAVLPALIVLGIGFGLIMAPSISSATLGVRQSDSGVASAMVNTCQQIGGSIGTAVLSTVSATATASFAADHAHDTPQVLAQAAVHGYTTAFLIAAAFFAVGAISTALLLEGGAPKLDPDAAPALAH